MTAIIIPITATQQEIRCDALICRNNLDIPEDRPLDKYSVYLDRISEPQDADGKRVGERQRLPTLKIPTADVLAHEITLNGLTLTGAQIMGFVNALVDDYKADSLPA
jgi:hypothetical protein